MTSWVRDFDKIDGMARALYGAYFQAADGRSLAIPERELGTFDEMPENIRYAWRSVAMAALCITEKTP